MTQPEHGLAAIEWTQECVDELESKGAKFIMMPIEYAKAFLAYAVPGVITLADCEECDGTGADPDDNEGVCRACEEK